MPIVMAKSWFKLYRQKLLLCLFRLLMPFSHMCLCYGEVSSHFNNTESHWSLLTAAEFKHFSAEKAGGLRVLFQIFLSAKFDKMVMTIMVLWYYCDDINWSPQNNHYVLSLKNPARGMAWQPWHQHQYQRNETFLAAYVSSKWRRKIIICNERRHHQCK